MVRNRSSERKIGKTEDKVMKDAVQKVHDGMSIRSAAKTFDIKNSTLRRYVEKYKNTGGDAISYSPNYSCRRVFTSEEELVLKNYLVKASEIHYGLGSLQVRELAYELAVRNNKKFPTTWEKNKCAGDDWFYGYMKRYSDLSLRRPEATSLSRATSFNKTNVGEFFKNLERILKEHDFTPNDIYNADETGCSTVQRVTGNKVVALKKMKQVGKITSGERGALVTLLCTINAAGNTIPPFMIFPRVHFKDRMINGAPAGSVGAANQSGWMTTENFILYMRHFIKVTKCSIENPVLLILDNHDTHLSIQSIDLAREHGVVMLTLPPHCSHRLQPLDRTVYGPFKSAFNRAADAFMVNHPGQPITIYDIAGLVGTAYPLAFTHSNIVSGFSCTGIQPYNPNVFTEEDFLCAYVTDRDEPVNNEGSNVTSSVSQPVPSTSGVSQPPLPSTSGVSQPPLPSTSGVSQPPLPSTSGVSQPPLPSTSGVSQPPLPSTSGVSQPLSSPPTLSDSDVSLFRPEQISPFPKAGPRKGKGGGRKRGKSLILTSTPVKETLREEQEKRKQKKPQKKVVKPKRLKLNKENKKRKSKKNDNQSESEDEDNVIYDDSSDYEEELNFEEMELPTADSLDIDDFVLVKFHTNKSPVMYTGQIQRIYADDDDDDNGGSTFDVRFLRRKTPKTFTFVFPSVDDISEVLYEDIIGRLPKPLLHGGTARVARHMIFPVDLDCYTDVLR